MFLVFSHAAKAKLILHPHISSEFLWAALRASFPRNLFSWWRERKFYSGTLWLCLCPTN